jgi:hypothetical protein
MGFRNSLEWQLGSVKSKAIAYLTHGSFLTGQRERYVTVYPFANMIINGSLAKKHPAFSNFKKNEVFIFCNYRPRGDYRPDLLAFTSKGDVFLVEGKQRKSRSESAALDDLKKGIDELKRYLHELSDFSQESSQSPYECWESVFRNCYVRKEKHGFPELKSFISVSLRMHGEKEIHDLFKIINDNLIHRRILFGLAINDSDDIEPFFPFDAYDLMPLKEIEYKTNPKDGVRKSGYYNIEETKIRDIIKKEWDERLGQLFIFRIDKGKSNFRLLDPV